MNPFLRIGLLVWPMFPARAVGRCELVAAWGLLSLGCIIAADAPDSGTGILRGRVIDDRSGALTPCTVAIVDSGGGLVIERESFKTGFRCGGEFEKILPAGRTRIRVTRGLETRAVERVVDLEAGAVTQVDFSLDRIVDLRSKGWFAGDSHVHMVHGERTVPVDFDYVALTARAEDLCYLSLSHAWAFEDPTPERLAAELNRRSTADCQLTWNLEAPKNYYRGDAGRCLGHCWSVGMRGRTGAGGDVIQLLLEASAGDYESEKPSYANYESHRLIREQGGAVFYTHPMRWWTGPWGGQGIYPKVEKMRVSNLAVELPLDTLLGPTYDGLDIMTSGGELSANAAAFELWALLLNHGYRLAATASSDACFDRPGGAVPGAVRTYTFLDQPFSLPAVARATAAGRTMVTTGPLALVSVGGRPPGTVFPADGTPRRMHIEAWTSGSSTGGLGRVEVLRNGKPFEVVSFDPALTSWQTNLAVRDSETAWYCVRVFGDDSKSHRAVTGAFYFEGQDYRPPVPTPARVRARIVDARTGRPLAGRLTEVTFAGPTPRDGPGHSAGPEGVELTLTGAARLRAESDGFEPLLLSPFFDHAPLLELITGLEATDLANWETFERVRTLLSDVPLTFALNRRTP